MSRPPSVRGQALLALTLVLAPLAAVALAVVGAGRLAADQTRLQAGVDAAAYAAAALESEALNAAAVGNRLLAAHLATTGQATSLVSHFRALDRAADAASALGVAFPVLAPAVGLLGRATDLGVAASTALARGIVPAAGLADRAVTAKVRLALLTADARLAGRAAAMLAATAPGARLTAATRARLRSAPLARAVAPGDPRDVVRVATASRERFTAGRAGRPPLGRTWRLAGAGKTGATRLGRGADLEATDRIGLALPGRGGLSLEARARGSEFGHGALPAGWTLRGSEGPAPVRIEATLESWGGRRLAARAAAAAVYRRPGRPGERADLFGPFWRPRLVPFVSAAPRDYPGAGPRGSAR